MRTKRNLRVSLENRLESLSDALPQDDNLYLNTTEADVDMIPSSDVKLATDVISANADAGEAVDALDKLSAVTEQLETVRENIAATLPSGGLTPAEAGAYAVATDAIVSDLGVQQVMPTMESFGSSMSRVRATQISMEAVDNVIVRVAKRIGEVLAALFERIARAIVKLARRFTSDLNRAKKIQSRLNLITGREASESEKISLYKEDANYLGGSKLSQSDVLTNLDAFESLLTKALPQYISTVIQGRKIDKYEIGREMNFMTPFAAKEHRPVGDEGIDKYEVALVIPESETGKTDWSVSGKEVAPLVDRAVQMLGNSKIESVSRYLNDVERKIGSIVSRMGEKADEDTKKNLTDMRSLLTSYGALATSAIAGYSGLVSAILDLGSAYLKAHGKQSDGDNKDKKD